MGERLPSSGASGGNCGLSELLSLAAIGVLLLALGWTAQRSFIYFPQAALLSSNAAHLTGLEPVEFETADGLRLGGWFIPASGTGRTTVLVLNGNAGNRSYRAPLAEALVSRGLSTLLFDYRGYGGNPGRPSERGLLADGRAAATYLASRSDVDSGRIVYWGESLGAAVAVALAVERPPAALILRSPFTSLADIGRYHYGVPLGRLLRDRYSVIDLIDRLDVPLLVVAGERDRIVPADHSRAVFERARAPKRFVVVPGADHNDPDLLAGERLMEEARRFLEEVGLWTVRPR